MSHRNLRSQSPCPSIPSNGSNGHGGAIPMEKFELGNVSGTDNIPQKLQPRSSQPSGAPTAAAVALEPLSLNTNAQHYSLPDPLAKPNRYFVPGRRVTRGLVQSRRQYVAEIGIARYGYHHMNQRMKAYQSQIDHKFVSMPCYYGYGPGYQTGLM